LVKAERYAIALKKMELKIVSPKFTQFAYPASSSFRKEDPMNVVSPDFLTGNLHFKPFCVRISRGVVGIATTMQKNASTTEWHGHIVTFLSKASIVACVAVCIPLALAEAVAAFVLAGIGIALNRIFLDSKSEFFQKHSVKALSYAVHSAVATIVLFVLGIKNPNLKFQTTNAVLDHVLHIGSAGFIQCTFGAVLDRSAGRSAQLAITRSINLFSDSHPDLLNDIGMQLQEDFDINIRARMRQIPGLEPYLNRHPEDRDFARDFNFQTLLQDSAYRLRAGAMLQRYLAEMDIIQPQVDGADALNIDLNQNNIAESAYQRSLADLLKASFLEIYRTPDLYHCMDKDGQMGNDLLEMMDAATYVPLTTYTQYKELLRPIQCPSPFVTRNLRLYDQRRAQLIAAKAQVEQLNEGQKRELVQKIFRGSDVVAAGPVQAAYLSISRLAPPLYQGPLMTKTAIDLHAVENGDVVQVRSLFQKACQDAIAEIAQG